MFTGLVQHISKIKKIAEQSKGFVFLIENPYSDLVLGESISINGACLTVTEFNTEVFQVFLSPETLQRTSAVRLKEGEGVNLERALRLSDRLGGHIVLGHVDETLQVTEINEQADFSEIYFGPISQKYRKHVLEKGSIALDGVSLTVNAVIENNLKTGIIPQTLKQTTFGTLKVGDRVNVEYDYLVKAIQNEK